VACEFRQSPVLTCRFLPADNAMRSVTWTDIEHFMCHVGANQICREASLDRGGDGLFALSARQPVGNEIVNLTDYTALIFPL
jgi:hypothetical protein